ncbi:hypothetical protein CDIK_1862 [Cucumispora dikerogammari]|nr:hypothetical protein CDIK_1862 [Cucumispora dikerogammari]
MASFGIKTLDNDFPLNKGKLILIKEDEYSNNHILFIQIFCAANKFDVYGIGALNIPGVGSVSTATKTLTHKQDEITYPPIDTLNLKDSDNKKKLEKSNKIAWKYISKAGNQNTETYDMINTKKLNCSKYIYTGQLKDNAIILSLFSPIYFEDTDENAFDILINIHMNQNLHKKKNNNIIYKQLFQLRRLVKMENKTVFVTVPAFLYPSSINWNLYADFVFRLERYEYYNGLLIVEKGGINRFGFKVNSKGLLLEEVIVPPEGVEEEKTSVYDF